MRGWIGWAAAVLFWAAPALAQEGAGVARLAGPASLTASTTGVALEVPLSQPVPWRARLWDDPPRAVIDFRRVEFGGLELPAQGPVVEVRTGEAGGGWSRLVVELDRPMTLAALGLRTDPGAGTARLTLRMQPATAEDFDRQRRALDPGGTAPPPTAAPLPPVAAPADRAPLRVMLDPGHGGVDPGAVHGTLTESALVLAFALDLADALRRAGGFEVGLTRDDDRFVALETRVRLAREFGADVLVSLHADALEDGEAIGATIYTLSLDATDAASAQLAERHGRANLLGGGTDLTGVDDEVALILMDMARAETRPRTERLVAALIGAIRAQGLAMHRRPWQEAAFAVLKAPDIPAVLIELGFLSSAADRARLTDPAWRARMVAALVAALEGWRDDEAGRRLLSRQ
jgi:N-acetylmuramoyl-L-alanine amidase